MSISRIVALVVGLLLTLGGLVVAATGTTALAPLALLPPFGLPSFVLWLVGMIGGACLTFAALRDPFYLAGASGLYHAAAAILLILGFALLMLLAATAGPTPIPPVRAALIFLCGTLASLTTIRTLLLLGGGESIQFETNWGGLGEWAGGGSRAPRLIARWP
jgi:hypothetical protein